MMVANFEGLAGFTRRNRRSCEIFYARREKRREATTGNVCAVRRLSANRPFDGIETVGYYSWLQCCVYTLIFRHDSTVMIWPRVYQVVQYFTLNQSYRNQSTQSKSYFNNSLYVSLVIQKKKTVIHNLFSFADNSLSYKSCNLIAIHVIGPVIGRVDFSINW